jgi:CheY-like chemotaxis protein
MQEIKVLIVDDEDGQAEWPNTLRMWLELTGQFEVQLEAFGSAAPDAVRDFQPDIILLDWVLKHDLSGGTGDGVSLAGKWRNPEGGWHSLFDPIPIVIVTSWGSDELVCHLDPHHEELGIFVAYKDWEYSQILALMANALYRWRNLAVV